MQVYSSIDTAHASTFFHVLEVVDNVLECINIIVCENGVKFNYIIENSVHYYLVLLLTVRSKQNYV